MAYTGWTLPERERERLLLAFPPLYPDVIAHHVTLQFGVPDDSAPPEDAAFVVVGMTDDGRQLQTLVVSVNGNTTRPDGETFHITWSLDRELGAKPKDSKMAIKRLGYTVVPRTPFTATPTLFS